MRAAISTTKTSFLRLLLEKLRPPFHRSAKTEPIPAANAPLRRQQVEDRWVGRQKEEEGELNHLRRLRIYFRRFFDFSRQQVEDRWVGRQKEEEGELNHLCRRRVSYRCHPSMAALMGCWTLFIFRLFYPFPFLLFRLGKAGSHRGSDSSSGSRRPTTGVEVHKDFRVKLGEG